MSSRFPIQGLRCPAVEEVSAASALQADYDVHMAGARSSPRY